MARRRVGSGRAPTVKDFGDWWHRERYIKHTFGTSRNSPRSRQPESVRSLLDVHIYPLIGHLKMTEVNHTHKAALIKAMQAAKKSNGEPLSHSMIHHACGMLSTMFGDAEAAGYPMPNGDLWYLEKSPRWGMVKTPAPSEPETEVPPPDIVAKVVVALQVLATSEDERLAESAQAIAFIVILGLRAQEARLLRWGQVDERPEIFEPAAGRLTFDADDTKPGREMTRPLPHELLKFLPRRPARCPLDPRTGKTSGDPGMRVWPNATVNSLRPTLRLALEAAGARHDYTLISFRHAVAQGLERAGMNVIGIRKFLDHRSLQTTYTYLKSGHDEHEKAVMAAKLASRISVGL